MSENLQPPASGLKPALWTDAAGRTWSTAINVNAIRRAKDLAGVNLLEVFDGDLLPRLADDPVLLVNTLFAVCKPQADERSLTDEQFGELLVGDTIELAAAALVQGMADFFPQDRRAVLLRLWAATVRTRTEAIRMATAKLDSPLIDQAIDAAIRQRATPSTNGCGAFPWRRRRPIAARSRGTARQPHFSHPMEIHLGARRNPRRRSRPPDAARTALDVRRAASGPLVAHGQPDGPDG